MKRTGLEIVEMIAKEKAPKKIKRVKDNTIMLFDSFINTYTEDTESGGISLFHSLNDYFEIIDDFEIIEEPKVWKPKYNQVYFYINFAGEIVQGNWIDDSMDKYNYDTGNCFKAKLEGKKEKERKIIKKRLERYALEHNEEKIDWYKKEQEKWAINYILDTNRLEPLCYVGDALDIDNIYFTSKKLCEQAIKEIGKDNIKKLFE